MNNTVMYCLVGLLAILCLIEELIHIHSVKNLESTKQSHILHIIICWILYSAFLVCAVFADFSVPFLFLGLIIIKILPYIKTLYLDMYFQLIKTIIFMTIILIFDGFIMLYVMNIRNIENYTLIRPIGLCLAQAVVVISSFFIRKTYENFGDQNVYDAQKQKSISGYLIFCIAYIVADALLGLLHQDSNFVALTMIAGNALILLILIIIFFFNHRIALQSKYEWEYHRLEAEKALQEWDQQKLLAMAQTDTLTGTYSRRYVIEQLSAYDQAKTPYIVVYIDIDGMKKINDDKGHAAGDQYLKDFTQAFTSLLPANSFFARMGGDEFIVVFTGYKKNDVLATMNGITKKLSGYSFSFGIAESDMDYNNSSIIKKADTLMYQNKKNQQGGTAVC